MSKPPTLKQEARNRRDDKIRKEYHETMGEEQGNKQSWATVDKLARKYKVTTVTIYRILKKD